MSENNSKDTLYVPVNIKTRFEFFQGFGFSELLVTAIIGGISLFVAIIFYSITSDFYKGVLIVLISLSATAMAVRKNEINQSVVDMTRLFIRFFNSQQKYKYDYHNPYEKETK